MLGRFEAGLYKFSKNKTPGNYSNLTSDRPPYPFVGGIYTKCSSSLLGLKPTRLNVVRTKATDKVDKADKVDKVDKADLRLHRSGAKGRL